MTEKDSKAYMYVVECADGTLYTGYTTDVERRLKTHNAGKGAKYTRARLPVKLLYSEAFASKPEAMSAEALYQRTHGKITVCFLVLNYQIKCILSSYKTS